MLQSMGSQRVRHDLATEQQSFLWFYTKIYTKSINLYLMFYIPSLCSEILTQETCNWVPLILSQSVEEEIIFIKGLEC